MKDDVEKLFSGYYELTKIYADQVFKKIQASDREPMLKDLDKGVCDVARVELAIRKESEIIKNIKSQLLENVDSEWNDLSQTLEQEFAKHDKIDISENSSVSEYRSHVEDIIDRLEGENMIVESTETNIDPYSKKPIEEPVRIRSCKHKFDKVSVMQVLKAGRKGQLRCPHVGCQEWFTVKDLIDESKEDKSSDEDL